MVNSIMLKSNELGNGDASASTPSSASSTTANKTPMISYVKLRVLNANLKNAINNCRSILESAFRTANNEMRERIQDWLTNDAANFSFDLNDTDQLPLAEENKEMRQILCDLSEGPLCTLLSEVELRQLTNLIKPNLPLNKNVPMTVIYAPSFKEFKNFDLVDIEDVGDSTTTIRSVMPPTPMPATSKIYMIEDFSSGFEELDSKATINYSSSNETVVSAKRFQF